jgi:hypothetical protein
MFFQEHVWLKFSNFNTLVTFNCRWEKKSFFSVLTESPCINEKINKMEITIKN